MVKKAGRRDGSKPLGHVVGLSENDPLVNRFNSAALSSLAVQRMAVIFFEGVSQSAICERKMR